MTKLSLECGAVGALARDTAGLPLVISASAELWRREGRRWRKIGPTLAEALRGKGLRGEGRDRGRGARDDQGDG